MGKTDGEKAVDLAAAENLIGATSDLLGLEISTEVLGWSRQEEPKDGEDGESRLRRRDEEDPAGYA
jgi:predicted ATP-grasp superfamily ATP-dependent carboligase